MDQGNAQGHEGGAKQEVSGQGVAQQEVAQGDPRKRNEEGKGREGRWVMALEEHGGGQETESPHYYALKEQGGRDRR